jgi:predicted Zn-dependent protease
VSFFGFWPDYDCLRYYWYGYEPFYWYGYEPYYYGPGYPAAYDTGGNTYNYYTYNYGDSESVTQTPPAIDDESYPPANPPQEQQIDRGPASQTSADQLFDDAVNAFGTGDYSQAADKLAEAIAESPNDTVMPFAYVQALFAQCKYPEAAAAFRSAMAKAATAQKGQPQVFFPHGLYTNDDVLNQQIKALQDVVQDNPRNTDFQLMLGYQLLGAGRASEAVAPLQAAQRDTANIAACNTLLELTRKINNEAPADAVK